MMGAIVDIQIPGVSDESAGQNCASRGQVDNAEGEPYLPEDHVDSVLWARVMNPVLDWGDSMQHKAMRYVLGQRPCHETATKEENSDGRLKG